MRSPVPNPTIKDKHTIIQVSARSFRPSGRVLAAIVALALSGGAVPWSPVAGAAGPTVSAQFLVAGGVGDQQSPSVVGNTVVYEECLAPDWCNVKVVDVGSKQAYTLATSLANWVTGWNVVPPEITTGGTRAAWTNFLNMKDGSGEMFVSSLTDFSHTSLGYGIDSISLSGNLAIYHYRDQAGGGRTGLYMRDFSTGKTTLVSKTGTEGVTNGRVVAYVDERNVKVEGDADDGNTDIFARDIATGREYAISTAPGAQGRLAMWGNTVVFATESTQVFSHDLSTGKQTRLRTTPGTKLHFSIWGSVLVYVNLEANLGNTIYGYDLASGQEFVVASDNGMVYRTANVSGDLVVWDEHPAAVASRRGQSEIVGARLSGIATAPAPEPPQHPTTRAFPETGKAVRGAFLDYWYKHGSLAQQGLPITPEMEERSDLDGKVYRVQYFERAVFEEHLENQPPYNVLLSQLGTFRYQQQYPRGAGEPGVDKPASIRGGLERSNDQLSTHVYAIPTNGGRYYAVASAFSGGAYTFDALAPGTYYIVSYVEPDRRAGAAAYTRAVACKRADPNAACNDHTLQAVTVAPGETLRGIDATDLAIPEASIPPAPAYEGRCALFKETGIHLCGKFLRYWLTHGDLPQQGFPISNEFDEVSPLDGKTYGVQYFERAVFEHHPENQPPYDVLLSQLGTFQAQAKHGGP
jgi:hypothetical protein